MADKIKISIFKNEFIQNILTLLSGASIAQIITLITVPILTRVYTPEDFGFFAIYLSIANIIATVSTGRYELAVMIPSNRDDALGIVKGTFQIVLLVTLITFGIVFILKGYENKLSHFIEPVYFYFLPLSIFILGTTKVLLQWFSRQQEFKLQAKTKIIQSGVNSTTNIFFGIFFYLKSLGLFMGHIAGQAIQLVLFYVKFQKENKESIRTLSKKSISRQLKTHKNFPYFSAPMGFLNTISVDILIYALNLFYSTTLVGLYINANKVVNYPLNLISQSFTSVFYQKISETNKKVRLYLISYFSNLILVSLAMIPIILWGEEIFAFVLGKDWKIAGSIAKFIAPLTIASFAMRSVSNIFSLTLRNGILLIWQILYMGVILVVIFISKSKEFEIMLISVSFIGALLYFALAIVGYKIMKNTYDESN